MGKPLSEKGRLIREALRESSELGNSEIAAQLNKAPQRKQDALVFKAQDVSNQRTALRKAETGPQEPESVWAPRREMVMVEVTEIRPTESTDGGLTADDLRQLVALMRRAGGADRLVEVLDVIRSVSE